MRTSLTQQRIRQIIGNRFKKMKVKEEVSNYEAYSDGKVADRCKPF